MSKSKTSRKKVAKKSSEALTKQALAVTEANLARIEATENGQPPEGPTDGAVPVDAAMPKPKKGKGAKPAKQPKPKKRKPAKARKPSLMDHAIAVLKKHGKPMNCKEIVDVVLKAGEWKTDGKTPSATLYSAIIREIATKKKESRFVKAERGKFELAK